MTGLVVLASVLGVALLSKKKSSVGSPAWINGIGGAADDWFKRKFKKYDYNLTVEMVQEALKRQELYGRSAVDVRVVIFDDPGSRKLSTIKITERGDERYLITSYNNAKRIAFLYELETLFV